MRRRRRQFLSFVRFASLRSIRFDLFVRLFVLICCCRRVNEKNNVFTIAYCLALGATLQLQLTQLRSIDLSNNALCVDKRCFFSLDSFSLFTTTNKKFKNVTIVMNRCSDYERQVCDAGAGADERTAPA